MPSTTPIADRLAELKSRFGSLSLEDVRGQLFGRELSAGRRQDLEDELLRRAGYAATGELLARNGRGIAKKLPEGYTPRTREELLKEQLDAATEASGEADDTPSLQAALDRLDAINARGTELNAAYDRSEDGSPEKQSALAAMDELSKERSETLEAIDALDPEDEQGRGDTIALEAEDEAYPRMTVTWQDGDATEPGYWTPEQLTAAAAPENAEPDVERDAITVEEAIAETEAQPEPEVKPRSTKDAAELVLREAAGPMKIAAIAKAIIDCQLAPGLKGKTPAATIGATIVTDAKKGGRFVKTAPGTFDLRELNPDAAATRPA
jgi:hypothetical protein